MRMLPRKLSVTDARECGLHFWCVRWCCYSFSLQIMAVAFLMFTFLCICLLST